MIDDPVSGGWSDNYGDSNLGSVKGSINNGVIPPKSAASAPVEEPQQMSLIQRK